MSASLETLRIPVTILHVLAVGATALRLGIRLHGRKFWWDDGWALFAVLMDIVYLLTFWFRSDNAGSSDNLDFYIALNWVTNMMGTAVLWAARISIVVTINRLCNPVSIYKRLTAILPVAFFLMWLAIQIEKIVLCTRTTSWHHTKSVQCFLGEPIPATELALDVVSDLILFLIPLRILTQMNLPRRTRGLMTYVFGTSIIITLGNAVHIAFIYGSVEWATFILVAVSGHIESTIALMVCNLSVLIPAIHRLISKDPVRLVGEADGEYTETYWGTPTAMLGRQDLDDGTTRSSVKDSSVDVELNDRT